MTEFHLHWPVPSLRSRHRFRGRLSQTVPSEGAGYAGEAEEEGESPRDARLGPFAGRFFRRMSRSVMLGASCRTVTGFARGSGLGGTELTMPVFMRGDRHRRIDPARRSLRR